MVWGPQGRYAVFQRATIEEAEITGIKQWFDCPSRKGRDIMTRMEFYAECTARTLFPLQVLEESEEIKQALRDRDDEKVRELLDQFA